MFHITSMISECGKHHSFYICGRNACIKSSRTKASPPPMETMATRNHLSSDISTNLMVATIAEDLTGTIRRINIDKADRSKILGNLLEINKIVEESKSRQVTRFS